MKLPLKQIIEHQIGSDDLPNDARRDINRYLTIGNGLPILPVDWNWDYQVQKGEYRGNLVTRISKFYSERGFDLSPNLKTALGNIVSKAKGSAEVFKFQFTKKFNWNSGDFGDRGSCFWGGRNDARRILEENGAYAVKFFNQYEEGIARCWLIKDAPEEDCIIIFNGYGPWGDSLRQMSIVLSQYLGNSVKKIGLTNWMKNGNQDLLWINNFHGYLIGSPEVIKQYNDIDLKLQDSNAKCRCSRCGWGIRLDEDGYENHGRTYCRNCYDNLFAACSICGHRDVREDLLQVGDSYICPNHEEYIHWIEEEPSLREETIWLNGSNEFINIREIGWFICERTGLAYTEDERVLIGGQQVSRGALSEEERQQYGDTNTSFF